MPRYEYKVVPAPTKGLKGKGVRGAEARFSYAVQELMNGLSGYGWEYQRSETLPSTERSGLTGSTTEWRNVLVFRRLRENDADAFAPELLPAPEARVPGTLEVDPSGPIAMGGDAFAAMGATASIHTDVEWDNGGDGSDGDEDVSTSLAKLAEVRSSDEDGDGFDSEDDDIAAEADADKDEKPKA